MNVFKVILQNGVLFGLSFSSLVFSQTINSEAGGSSLFTNATAIVDEFDGLVFSFKIDRSITEYQVYWNAPPDEYEYSESINVTLGLSSIATSSTLSGLGETTGFLVGSAASWWDNRSVADTILVASSVVPRDVTIPMLRLKKELRSSQSIPTITSVRQ